MKRALVIRTVGDPETCAAIMDGMTRYVVPLDRGELAAVKAEVARLKAKDEIRSCGARARYETAFDELGEFVPETHGALYWAIVRPWALLWYVVYGIIDALDNIDWNA